MKAVLTFQLPEEAVEHRQALDGPAWESVVFAVDQFCRNTLKYGHEIQTADSVFENIREKIQSEIEDGGLPFSP